MRRRSLLDEAMASRRAGPRWPVVPGAPVRAALALAAATLAIGASGRAWARTRPLFEPTDLELENPGVVELDLQIGAVRGPGAWRAVLPDFEVDVGVLPNIEIDLDGAYAIEGPANAPFSFDHGAPDSLWPCVKVGLFDWREPDSVRAWAAGLQVGPKLPVASGTHGIGVESLVLVGRSVARLHLVLNLGVLVDPAAAAGAPRPKAVEGGLDVELELDQRFSLTGELGGMRFWSPDPQQLMATGGLAWSVTKRLDLSLVGLAGFLDGNDRYGLLLGLSPKLGRIR